MEAGQKIMREVRETVPWWGVSFGGEWGGGLAMEEHGME
jgi:hypothetical protein